MSRPENCLRCSSGRDREELSKLWCREDSEESALLAIASRYCDQLQHDVLFDGRHLSPSLQHLSVRRKTLFLLLLPLLLHRHLILVLALARTLVLPSSSSSPPPTVPCCQALLLLVPRHNFPAKASLARPAFKYQGRNAVKKCVPLLLLSSSQSR